MSQIFQVLCEKMEVYRDGKFLREAKGVELETLWARKFDNLEEAEKFYNDTRLEYWFEGECGGGWYSVLSLRTEFDDEVILGDVVNVTNNCSELAENIGLVASS